VCVPRYEQECEHGDGRFEDLDDLQMIDPETEPTVHSDHAWLEASGGHSVEYRRAEDRFERWLEDLREAGRDSDATSWKSPSYFVASSDATFATADGDVVISRGSIMLAQSDDWLVVQGRASPPNVPFAPSGSLPEALLWLGNGNRPGVEELARAKPIAEKGRDDLSWVVRTDLQAALRLGASSAVALLENNPTLAQAGPAAVAPGPTYAAVLKPDGAGIFAVVPTQRGGAALGRLVHGWNADGGPKAAETLGDRRGAADGFSTARRCGISCSYDHRSDQTSEQNGWRWPGWPAEVKISYLWRPHLADPGDELVLETAVNGGAEMIATFDLRHLASAAARFGIAAARPGTVVRRLREQRS
jgi:hypothetical protein